MALAHVWDDAAIDERVLGILQRSPEGVRRAAIGKLSAGFRPPAAQLKARLEALEAAGMIHAWAGAFVGGEPWASAARGAVLEATQRGPVTIAAIKKAVPAALRDPKRLPKLLDALVAERSLFADPKKRYSRAPFPAADFLGDLPKRIQQLAKKLARGGIDEAAILAALSAALEPQKTSDPDTIMNAMLTLRPDAKGGALLEIRRLRAAVTWPKDRFDRALLDLAGSGAVSLHHHDHASGLSAAEREALVADGRGNFFLGVAYRTAP